MSTIGNIIWILLGGIWMSLGWVAAGVIMHPLVSHSLRPKRARVADGRGLVANGS